MLVRTEVPVPPSGLRHATWMGLFMCGWDPLQHHWAVNIPGDGAPRLFGVSMVQPPLCAVRGLPYTGPSAASPLQTGPPDRRAPGWLVARYDGGTAGLAVGLSDGPPTRLGQHLQRGTAGSGTGDSVGGGPAPGRCLVHEMSPERQDLDPLRSTVRCSQCLAPSGGSFHLGVLGGLSGSGPDPGPSWLALILVLPALLDVC